MLHVCVRLPWGGRKPGGESHRSSGGFRKPRPPNEPALSRTSASGFFTQTLSTFRMETEKPPEGGGFTVTIRRISSSACHSDELSRSRLNHQNSRRRWSSLAWSLTCWRCSRSNRYQM